MGGHSAVTLSVRLSHEVSLFMFQMVEARARTAFVMAYNPALVHLVPTGAPYRTNVFGRAWKLLVSRAPWMIDSDSVLEALTLPPIYRNALRTLPDKTRATSAKSLATLCVLVVAWPLLLLCY